MANKTRPGSFNAPKRNGVWDRIRWLSVVVYRTSRARATGSLLLYGLVTMGLWPAAGVGKEVTEALVQVDNDLWIVDQGGTPIQRLTADGREKWAAAWSPDGQRLAYTPAPGCPTIILMDRSGRALSQLEIKGTSVTAVRRLGWAGPNLLWYQGHTGPWLGAFALWELPRDYDMAQRKLLIECAGHDCVLSPDDRCVVCIGESPGRMPPGVYQGEFFALNSKTYEQELSDDFNYPEGANEIPDGAKFEGGVTWDSNSRRFAIVENRGGDRRLVVVDALGSKSWKATNVALAGIVEAVEKLRFNEDGRTVILDTTTSAYTVRLDEKDVPPEELGAASKSMPGLPGRIKVRLPGRAAVEVDVFDWYVPAQEVASQE